MHKYIWKECQKSNNDHQPTSQWHDFDQYLIEMDEYTDAKINFKSAEY